MSQVGDQKLEKRSRGRSANKLESAFRKGRIGAGVADWMSCDESLLRRAVAAAGYAGGALRFGYTSDGGAYAVGVYDGDEKTTIYVRPGENINEELQRIIDYFGTA